MTRSGRTSVLAVVRGAAAVALGAVVGFGVWFAVMAVLAPGLSFYAVVISPWVGLAVTVIAAPLLYRKVRRDRPAWAPMVLLMMLGAAAFLLVTSIEIGRT